MDWSPKMQVKTEVGYKVQSYCRGGSGNGTGYLIQCSRLMGHIMWDQQIILEANTTKDEQVPETEGPVKATDQFNGWDKHAGESELSMEGMCFGSGWMLQNRLEGCWEWDRERGK